jgi:hypothetical protein
VLRRSLTLVMETCTITIPTVTSVYCQQSGILPSWHLLRDVFSTRLSREHAGKRLSLSGRRRLLMQLFACMYVLVFPTLTSVMTGYRTGLTGLFSYTNGTVSEVKPLAQIGYPRMTLGDGSRVGLANSNPFVSSQLPVPDGHDIEVANFLLGSESFEEPAGILADCKCESCLVSPATSAPNLCHSDYLTCRAVIGSAQLEQMNTDLPGPYEKPFTFACAFHDCSCSVSGTSFGRTTGNYSIDQLSANTTSNITIQGTHISLPAPPLNINLAFDFSYTSPPGSWPASGAASASEYWHEAYLSQRPNGTLDYQGNSPYHGIYFKGSEYTADFVKSTGICIASEA